MTKDSELKVHSNSAATELGSEICSLLDERDELRRDGEIQRLKLSAEVAELDERLTKSQKDAALTGGARVFQRAYLQHLREKALMSIKITQLEDRVAGAKVRVALSKTTGAQQQWRRREQMKRQGWALGGGGRRDRLPQTAAKGPEEEARRKLTEADFEYRVAKSDLDELCKKDSYFDALVKQNSSPAATSIQAHDDVGNNVLLPKSRETARPFRRAARHVRVDVRKQEIASIKAGEPGILARNICLQMDWKINRAAPVFRERIEPLPSWIKKANGKRTWKEVFDDKHTHHSVRSFVNKVPALKTRVSPPK
jgi:hypothetical protein